MTEPTTLTVRDLMSRQGKQGLFRVNPEHTVKQAAHMMQNYAISAIAVVEDRDAGLHLLGIISEKDISHLVARGGDPASTPVSAIMATDLVTATLDTSLWETARFMLERNIRHLPVLDGETPITTISMRDVLGLVIEVLSKENESLRSDLQWVTYIYTQGT